MTEMVLFQGPGFVVQKPSEWLAVATEQYQAALLGPMVGSARVGFLVSVTDVDKDDDPLKEVFERIKGEQQEKLTNYHVAMERDLSRDNVQAYSRNFTWYNGSIDMVIVERQVFMQVGATRFVVTSTQPNSEVLAQFDKLFVEMFNSFRVGELVLENGPTQEG
ncbi:MAG: hypothetical protein H6642_06135 [Caldilineaceae bacterium]|nr:hypothetical protein [Caldilineaceae bacterium]